MSTAILGDPREEKALSMRREREAERLKRIKDPATCGQTDFYAIESQIADKQATKAADAQRENAYDQERLMLDQQLMYLEQERVRAERQKLKEVNEFRATQQGKERSRDFDLNDPNFLLTSQPMRVGDDDPRLSVSGLQKFHGEDLSHAHRIKAQRDEIRQWSDEMAAEKAAAKAQEQADEAAYANSMMQIDAMKTQLENAAQNARKQSAMAQAEYHKAQAAAKKERERAQQIAELQQNVEEIQANLAGSTLTEDPSVGRSYIAPNRLRPDHYKGMSPEEQQAVLNEQAYQRNYNAASRDLEKAEQAKTDAEMEALRQTRCNTEALVAQKRAEMRQSLLEQNRALAKEQASTQAFLDTKVYPNAIDEDFFSQFNTTSR